MYDLLHGFKVLTEENIYLVNKFAQQNIMVKNNYFLKFYNIFKSFFVSKLFILS